MEMVFIFELVAVQELNGHSEGDAELFPLLHFGEGAVRQLAEAAIVSFGTQNLVSEINEAADRVAVAVVDKDKFHG